MTPDELDAIRTYVGKWDTDDTQWYIARDLLAEVDLLNAKLNAARTKEVHAKANAWDAGWCDRHLSTHDRDDNPYRTDL